LNRTTGASAWTFQTGDEVDSSPVLVGQRVVVASADGRVYALQIADGSMTWSYEIGSPVTATPAVIGDVIVVGAEDGRVDVLGRPEERS
jgi:outer membrane protein assembly factor BamB